ncbi:MAG: hypothetical protein IJT16_09365 [Lachnospiraceae bacterium]|nr:hypothetical protein [Lachnospiraceae bacterium]
MKRSRIILYFSLYIFLYTTLVSGVSLTGAEVLSIVEQQRMYYADMLALTLGFFSAGFFVEKYRERQSLFVDVFCVLAAIALVGIYFFPDRLFFLYYVPLAVYGTGFMGGLAYYKTALGIRLFSKGGFIVAASQAAAFILQYFLQFQADVPLLLCAVSVSGYLFFALLTKGFGMEIEKKYMAFISGTERAPEERVPEASKAFAFRLCLITAGSIALAAFFDNWLERRMTESALTGELSAFSWPRLILIPVFLVCGLIFDRWGEKLLSVVVFCVDLISVLIILLLKSGQAQIILCLFYVLVSAVSAWYQIMFLHRSPDSKLPALWAVMGRLIDGGITLFLALFSVSLLPAALATAVALVVLIVILVCMILNGYFAFGVDSPERDAKAQETENVSKASTPSERETFSRKLDAFSLQYELTLREKDVLKALTQSEKPLTKVAAELEISRTMLYRYLNRIYEKTGLSSREELAGALKDPKE